MLTTPSKLPDFEEAADPAESEEPPWLAVLQPAIKLIPIINIMANLVIGAGLNFRTRVTSTLPFLALNDISSLLAVYKLGPP